MYRPLLTSILVKPAGPDCSMACGYCFYSGKSSLYPGGTHHMTNDVLEWIMRDFLSAPAGEFTIGWQGGEPTLMGLLFFEKAVALEEKHGAGKTIGNGLQTNGLLIDRAWAKFLKKYNFLVGLSIDGPEEVHDHYRVLRGGGGTHARVAAAAHMLLNEGVPVNALTVVNDHSVRFPDEIYDHHRKLGLDFMQFIPCVETDPSDPGRAAPFSVNAEAYGTFLCRLFDRWRADFRNGEPATSIRFFESLLFACAGLHPPDCTLCETCGTYLAVEHNGDVYACDFFVEPEWKLGNVMERKLAAMFESAHQREFGARKAALTALCKSCPWLALCRGGCPKDRVRDPRDHGVSHFCAAYKIFFEHAGAELKKIAASRSNQQEAERARRARIVLAGSVGRNDPCPCGSGLKYKKCCGR
ncbi:MAG TPA: anaerobic sulfatase maturase [Smithella sp.]|nr:anaerobic sulfatase maturase [Smithella sp.]HOG91252.1 anaerobic sulfatase maturase [Smithella sp.]HOU51563.1 anaerobic sulfatase maturase [Smithella sp.]HQG66108.1 anaerobic sulfatase maturase [Smithella sp.]HQH17176.1 anaerobic sulfatase maturase [Smithella sp.]